MLINNLIWRGYTTPKKPLYVDIYTTVQPVYVYILLNMLGCVLHEASNQEDRKLGKQ